MHAPTHSPDGVDRARAHAIFLDLDTVLLAAHQGRRGVELGVQADLGEGIDRLAEIADQIVVLAYPASNGDGQRTTAEQRVAVLRDGIGTAAERLLVVICPHHDGHCTCAKPGDGLIEVAVKEHGLARRGGWYVGADQEGVVSGRTAGLRTVRIGPLGADHLSSVHRPDYEARDLLDAANHILVAELS
jgi:histidinol phosphatase-like enzyme